MLLFCIDECESHTHICVCDYCNAIEKCPAPFHEQTEILPELKLNKNIIYKAWHKRNGVYNAKKNWDYTFYNVFEKLLRVLRYIEIKYNLQPLPSHVVVLIKSNEKID